MNDATPIKPSATEAPIDAAPPPPAGNPRARRRWLLILALVVVIGLIAWGAHALFFAGATETTDDAYVAGDVVAITAREPGVVVAIHADNTEQVRAGQVLIEFDPSSVDAQLAAAEAELARSVRAVRADTARVGEGEASVVAARAELARRSNDLARRREAAAEGAISSEELAHAADEVTAGRAALQLAQAQLTQARAAVQGTEVSTNPAVLSAAATLRRAGIAKGHMRLVAPVDGVIAQRTVQLGQQVGAGTPLMAVVPLQRLWIDANFRETQLRRVRIGQPVTVTADIYGDEVVYHGRVTGLSAGSGSAFAVLPPQNASGNWIKISQRLPVRIALDPRELQRNPLRIGLSTKVTVDVANASGPPVARAAAGNFQRQSAPADDADAEARIARIIAANRGLPGR